MSTDQIRTAPYGSWHSPIALGDVVAAGASMSSLIGDGADLWWLETRPDQDSRSTVMRMRDGLVSEITPATTNIRSRVNEYGGGAFHVRDDVLAYCDDSDHTVKLRSPDGTIRALTAGDPLVRYGDLRVHPKVPMVLAVREDHRVDGEAETTLVGLGWPDGDGPGAEVVLCRGADFYANPTLSDDGRLAWLEWRHPAMPWDSTLLKVGQFDTREWKLTDVQLVAGRSGAELDGVAVHHPRWSIAGTLLFTSDASGFFQLAEWDGRGVRALHADQADFDLPMFVLGNHAHADLDANQILTWRLDEGLCHLAIVSRVGVPTRRLAGVAAVDSVASTLGVGYAIVDRPVDHRALVRVEPDGTLEVLRTLGESPDRAYCSVARSLVFQGRYGPVQAWYYPPNNPDYRAPGGTRPPALMRVHGGPTALTSNAYNATVQFWTSRGFAVLDVNYSGSAGFGRRWRDRLQGLWGVADVDDCIDAAEAAIDAGLADPGRLVISGGSSGGFTALRALTTSDRFAAAIVRYGVVDLTALLDTHKFESRYLDSLIGRFPADEKLYQTRSPINNLDRLRSPILVLQGSDDPVVPLSQATQLADAVRARGLPLAVRVFEGEGHGFRKAQTRSDALAAEYSFCAQIFGFAPADDLPLLEVENLPPATAAR